MTTASAYPASAQQAKRDTPGKEVTGLTDSRTAQADVATCVFGALKTIVEGDPGVASCTYEQTPTDAQGLPCITMQTLDGTPVERRYLDGGRVENYRFALLLRRQALEDQDRLDARALLERVASSLAEADVELGEGRTAWDLSLDTLPYRAELAADYADWKAELTLKYQTNR